MKLLLIGDYHVKKDNLEESKALMTWIKSIISSQGIHQTVFLGDQYNDFGVVRTEIAEFWYNTFAGFSPTHDIALVGNHDEDSSASSSAMTVHKDQINVVGKSVLHDPENNLAFVGFIRDNEEFIKTILNAKAYNPNLKYVFCHAEFDGARFETGFYAPHGIDTTKLPQDVTFISGHIHVRSQFGNIVYVGTPRPLIKSDANQVKSITVFDTLTGKFDFIPVPTEIVTPYVHLTVDEAFDISQLKKMELNDRTYLDVKGSPEFIKSVAKIVKSDVNFRSFPTKEEMQKEVRESDGVGIALRKYFDKYCTENNIPVTLRSAMEKKINDSRILGP